MNCIVVIKIVYVYWHMEKTISTVYLNWC